MPNPREPKNVKKLIQKHQNQQVESAVVAFVKKIIKSDQARRDGHGGGTRGERR